MQPAVEFRQSARFAARSGTHLGDQKSAVSGRQEIKLEFTPLAENRKRGLAASMTSNARYFLAAVKIIILSQS